MIDCIDQIPGAGELSSWFGGFPSFHDANAELRIDGNGTGWLKAYGFRMTNDLDENGYYVLDKHFVATFYFEELKSVSIADFLPGLTIIGRLAIQKSGDLFEVNFEDTSYGFSGVAICGRLRVEFEPNVKAP